MNARVELPGPAERTIAGQRAAESVLERIAAGTSDPEALLRGALRELADDGFVFAAPPPALAGYLRRVQKAIEQQAGVR